MEVRLFLFLGKKIFYRREKAKVRTFFLYKRNTFFLGWGGRQENYAPWVPTTLEPPLDMDTDAGHPFREVSRNSMEINNKFYSMNTKMV